MSHQEVWGRYLGRKGTRVDAWARRIFIGFLVSTCLVTACQAAENPLIGSWRWDLEKTLRNIQAPPGASKGVVTSAAKAKKYVEGMRREVGSMTVTYSDHNYVQIEYDTRGTEFNRRSGPYAILQIEKDFVVIDQQQNGDSGKLFFEGSNSFYVEVQVGEYTYRDYFTRM